MQPDDLLELIRRQPFVPFRIHITGGTTYVVHDPDRIVVLQSRAVLAVGGDDEIPEHLEHVALVHVVRVEELPDASSYASS